MTGVSLDSLDVTAVELEFVGNAGMTQAVEDNFREIMVLNQLSSIRVWKALVIVWPSTGPPKGPANTRP